jgi:hypothetical protein
MHSVRIGRFELFAAQARPERYRASAEARARGNPQGSEGYWRPNGSGGRDLVALIGLPRVSASGT